MHEVFGDVAHHLQAELGGEDAGVLPLVLLEDVGLDRAAHLLERGGLDLLVGLAGQDLVARHAEEREAEAVVALGDRALVARAGHAAGGVERVDPGVDLRGLGRALLLDPLLALLVDRGVQEEAEQHRRRTVDRHRHRRRRIGEVEAGVELLGVVDAGDRHARVADLAVDVRPVVGILAVERDRVERRRQPLGRQPARDVVEALVGALGAALAGEHARRVLALALEREDARGVREVARRRLAQEPGEDVAPVLVGGERHLGDLEVRERLAGQVELDHLVAHLELVLGGGVATLHGRPLGEELLGLGGEPRLELLVERDQLGDERRLPLHDLGDLHAVVARARLDDLEPGLADVGA